MKFPETGYMALKRYALATVATTVCINCERVFVIRPDLLRERCARLYGADYEHHLVEAGTCLQVICCAQGSYWDHWQGLWKRRVASRERRQRRRPRTVRKQVQALHNTLALENNQPRL